MIVSRSMIIALIICFFLPFITVSCGEIASASLSGIKMVTGGPVIFNTPQGPQVGPEPVKPNTHMIGAFVLAIASLGVTFLKTSTRIKSIALTVASGLGTILFLTFKATTDSEAAIILKPQGIVLRYEFWFWLAWALFLGIAIVNSVALYKEYQQSSLPRLTPTLSVANNIRTERLLEANSPSLTLQHCPSCHKEVEVSSNFCMYCGERLIAEQKSE